MSCCSTEAIADVATDAIRRETDAALIAATRTDETGAELILNVPDISCGKCIGTVEGALNTLPEVKSARVNLTLRRVAVHLDRAEDAPEVVAALERIGYPAFPLDLSEAATREDREFRHLLKAVAVAGFAAGNVMLLSVSVWSGAEGATRDLFHLISGLIALPAAAYAGQTFYRSAFRALRAGRLNMDVPITLAVILALAMSIYESLTGGAEAYFDAAVMLLFFLLIGRTLDRRMRDQARQAVIGLSRLAVKGAQVVGPDGRTTYMPLDEVEPGMTVRIAPGARIPADGRILTGTTDLDRALVTGESVPVPAAEGDSVEAGTLNLTGPFDMTVEKTSDQSYLAEVMRMMEAAETGRGTYVRIADRMAQIYAPAVHLLAAITAVGWWFATGDFQAALYTAIAVLIVTCPCALGLAVPVVHVIGAGRLFENGILMKDGAALERLAEADHVLFDKTGTLTTGTPNAVAAGDLPDREAAAARALAAGSSHPAAQAVATLLSDRGNQAAERVREYPGAGVEGWFGTERARLGRPGWVAEIATQPSAETGLAFAFEGGVPRTFRLRETLRDGAAQAVQSLKNRTLPVELLSGDNPFAVARIARALDIGASDNMRPDGKIARIGDLQAGGAHALMVGDGLNDAPALRAAHVSMAPGSASDVGRMAADFVFTRPSLTAVPLAYAIVRAARRIVKQNFGLALAYNSIAVPLAMAGFVTPLIAAIAMSASSIVVIANSLRLHYMSLEDKHRPAVAGADTGALKASTQPA